MNQVTARQREQIAGTPLSGGQRSATTLAVSSRNSVRPVWLLWLPFFAAHVPLALIMADMSLASTVHALLTLGVGAWYALVGRDPLKVAMVGAYIIGAEVLWRTTGAGVFWEFGKYAIVAIFAISTLRLSGLKVAALPVVYFLVLLPSTILTLSGLGLSEARGAISFNLSGPLALMVCALFFSGLKLGTEDMQKLFLTAIGPIVGIASIVLSSTLTAGSIQWVDDSNFVTSGGFGPNQVSNMLGLGALIALFSMWQGRASRQMQFLMLALVIALSTLSALTFSRSGIYNAGVAAAALVLFAVRDRASLLRLGLVVGVAFVAVSSFVLPRLEEFTQGAIVTRFQDTTLTGRQEIAEADLQVWLNNPLFGVGPGMAQYSRQLLTGPVLSHTELSRLLAEHGLLGLVALLTLVVMAARNIGRTTTAVQRGLVAAMLVWTFLFMLNSAMRLSAPSYVFGLTFALLLPQDQEHVYAKTEREAGQNKRSNTSMKPSVPQVGDCHRAD